MFNFYRQTKKQDSPLLKGWQLLHGECRICCYDFWFDIFGPVPISHQQVEDCVCAIVCAQLCVQAHMCVHLLQLVVALTAQFLSVIWGSRKSSSTTICYLIAAQKCENLRLLQCCTGCFILEASNGPAGNSHQMSFLFIKCEWLKEHQHKPVLPLG